MTAPAALTQPEVISGRLSTNLLGRTSTARLGDELLLIATRSDLSVTITIPPESAVEWPSNSELQYLVLGDGAVTFDPGIGVTIIEPADNYTASGVGIRVNLKKTGTNEWAMIKFGSGALGATLFPQLTDTPSNYTSAGGKRVVVNSGATALVFESIADIATTATNLDGTVWQEINDDGTKKKARLNTTATTDPTAGDDSADSFLKGSMWLNTSSGIVWQCIDATVGAAIWVPLVDCITPLHLGAKGDGSTGQGAKIRASWDLAITLGKEWVVPLGTWLAEDTLAQATLFRSASSSPVSVRGVDRRRSIIKTPSLNSSGGAMTKNVFYVDGASSVSIRDLSIDCTNSTGGAAINVQNCATYEIDGNYIKQAGGAGILANADTASSYRGRITNNIIDVTKTGHGIALSGPTGGWTGFGGDANSHRHYDVHITGNTIIDHYKAGMNLSQVQGGVVGDNTIVHYGASGYHGAAQSTDYAAIRLSNGTNKVTVFPNRVKGSSRYGRPGNTNDCHFIGGFAEECQLSAFRFTANLVVEDDETSPVPSGLGKRNSVRGLYILNPGQRGTSNDANGILCDGGEYMDIGPCTMLSNDTKMQYGVRIIADTTFCNYQRQVIIGANTNAESITLACLRAGYGFDAFGTLASLPTAALYGRGATAYISDDDFGNGAVWTHNGTAFKPPRTIERTWVSQATHTGDTTETAKGPTVAIPPLAAGDSIVVIPKWTKSGTAGVFTVRTKYDGTSIAEPVTSAGNQISFTPYATMEVIVAANSQVGHHDQPGAIGVSTTATRTLTKDTTASRNLTFTVQLGSAADTAKLESVTVKVIRH